MVACSRLSCGGRNHPNEVVWTFMRFKICLYFWGVFWPWRGSVASYTTDERSKIMQTECRTTSSLDCYAEVQLILCKKRPKRKVKMECRSVQTSNHIFVRKVQTTSIADGLNGRHGWRNRVHWHGPFPNRNWHWRSAHQNADVAGPWPAPYSGCHGRKKSESRWWRAKGAHACRYSEQWGWHCRPHGQPDCRCP